ncbi:MAG: hydantoinase/oxoprolinase, partial [Methanosaeta sp. ASP1-1]
LKADGGTLPLDRSLAMPVETIFSGPAASIMGVMALTAHGQTSVVVDIGGTTTDLALILSGKPLLSAKGARVDSLLTHVRAFAVKSVAIGGDSAVVAKGVSLTVGPHRDGPPMCMGGSGPTPTDALRVLGLSSIGDASRAEQAMQMLSQSLGCTAKEAARKTVDAVVDKIVLEINEMFREWESEPAYRIWEIMSQEKLSAQNVVGVGGGAPPLVPLVAERLGAAAVVPEHAPVANAIGAAVARPTLTLNLHIDTEKGEYNVAEEGLTGRVSDRKMTSEEAEKLARRLLAERASRLGIGEYAGEAEVTYSEVFNMIRGWSTVGRLLDLRLEVLAGLLPSWGRA